ncbi:MAG: sulfite exporter TauE/SafE family protein [Eubacteriales bacterium]
MQLIIYIIIGFLAQMIDGTMGMAYGVSCRTFLRSVAGLPPALASAVVHVSEIPTTLVSGISHFAMKNVDKKLLLKLLIPGVVGGVLGAYFLCGAGDVLEPVIDVYLIIMGGIIISKAIRGKHDGDGKIGALVYPLGLAGGFFDAAGGGGWGPIVTSTMVARGGDVKKTIGTVNTAEFIVTIAETTAFAALVGDFTSHMPIILGLVIGGVIAAPFAALLCKKIPVRPLLAAVGTLIAGLNIYNLIKFFIS